MSDYQSTPQPTPYTGAAPVNPTPIMSILSLIGGILSILTSFFFIGLLLGIAGVIFGFIGRRKEPQAKGLWLTGIITGFVGLAVSLIVIAFWVIIAIAAASQGAISTAP